MINDFSKIRMRALSWKEPFGTLMLHGKIETRSWYSHYLGWVLICTSKVPYNMQSVHDISGDEQFPRIMQVMTSEFCKTMIPMNGYAIAVGKLIHCRLMKPEDEDKCFVKYYRGLWCHIYENVMQIEPIPWKGSQGWRNIDYDIRKRIKLI